ncbi:YdcF family protein [Curvivirga aplysinae]|uniref:YdcF family protein n=1 Tax=Curvivirga aplysinae TaxID=2529852 RepID=UPI0012BC55F6|nr:YdcF family protein [Curvivirga aplysinae]MTI08820.1 YdcF family protein [Curvivirga aplysinae]
MPLLRRNKGRKRKTLAFCILIVASWVGGLLWFIDSIPKTPQFSDQKTDAIVVLTGGTLRLEEGLDLLERGLANKLFVSGVHRAVNVEELLRLSRETPSQLDCCITLGYEADNTQGNAMETALWMHEQGFKSMRLITGGYHMPRSLMELQYVLPDTEIILHPVYPDHVKLNDWYLWPGTSLLIIGEYNKTIFIPIRRLLTRLITAKD